VEVWSDLGEVLPEVINRIKLSAVLLMVARDIQNGKLPGDPPQDILHPTNELGWTNVSSQHQYISVVMELESVWLMLQVEVRDDLNLHFFIVTPKKRKSTTYSPLIASGSTLSSDPSPTKKSL